MRNTLQFLIAFPLSSYPIRQGGTLRKTGFVEVLLEMVFSAGHVCSSGLGYHSRGQREVTRTLGMFCQMGKSTRNQNHT